MQLVWDLLAFRDEEAIMTDVIRRTVNDVKPRVESGDALLVCAYDSDDKFAQYRLDGAIALSELRSKENALNPGQELIFYCA